MPCLERLRYFPLIAMLVVYPQQGVARPMGNAELGRSFRNADLAQPRPHRAAQIMERPSRRAHQTVQSGNGPAEARNRQPAAGGREYELASARYRFQQRQQVGGNGNAVLGISL